MMFWMNLFQHLFNSGEKYTFIDNQHPKQIDFREPLDTFSHSLQIQILVNFSE